MEEEVPHFDGFADKYVYYSLKYKVEFVLVMFLLTFLVNFFTGKKVNKVLASSLHN